jgi:ABC-type sugar transport system ATPase subunit
MNFVRGRLEEGVFYHAGGAVPLKNGAVQPGPKPSATGESLGRTDAPVANDSRPLSASGAAWLGVRPEDLELAASGPSLGAVTLDVVERMGHESMGYFRLGDQRCALRLAADSGLAAGHRIEPRIRAGAWHLFADDAEGNRIP